jgi:hypothetical protein
VVSARSGDVDGTGVPGQVAVGVPGRARTPPRAAITFRVGDEDVSMSAPSAGDRDERDHEAADDREWEVSLEDLERERRPAEAPIEPGSPSVENAAFVAVGVLLTLVLFLGGL